MPPSALLVLSTRLFSLFFFFFNDTATTEIYTLSLHDALPICASGAVPREERCWPGSCPQRSEEHTSELQSRLHLVCRLLLEKKKKSCTPPVELSASAPRASHSPPPCAN